MSHKYLCDGYPRLALPKPHNELVLAEYHWESRLSSLVDEGVAQEMDLCRDCFRALLQVYQRDGLPSRRTIELSRI